MLTRVLCLETAMRTVMSCETMDRRYERERGREHWRRHSILKRLRTFRSELQSV
jgi:hypothetical protein